jgi:hypothetical protein
VPFTQPPSATSPHATSSSSTSPITSSKPKTRRKLTQADRDFLNENNGCYFCREINAGHRAKFCPESLAVRAAQKGKEIGDGQNKETICQPDFAG